MLSNNSLRFLAIGLCFLGFSLSTYLFIAKDNYAHDKKYASHFDFSHFWSCSGHCHSKYATGFGLVGQYLGEKSPFNLGNGLLCMGFYALEMVLISLSRFLTVLPALLVALAVNALSVYMTYINIYVVQSMCAPYIGICAVDMVMVICLALLALPNPESPKPSSRSAKKTGANYHDTQQRKKTKKEK